MLHELLGKFLDKFELIYTFSATNPGISLLILILGYLLLRRKVKSALILLFGTALCLANYYIFSQMDTLAFPFTYTAAFAGVSIFLLLLLVYQLIHTS